MKGVADARPPCVYEPPDGLLTGCFIDGEEVDL
jgi:hypothetical protein